MPQPITTKLPSGHTVVIQPVIIPFPTDAFGNHGPPSDVESDEAAMNSDDESFSDDGDVGGAQAISVTATAAPPERQGGRYRRGPSGNDRSVPWLRSMAPKDVAWISPLAPSAASVPVKRVVRRFPPSTDSKKSVRTRSQRRAACRPDVVTAKPLNPFMSPSTAAANSVDDSGSPPVG